MEDSILLQKPLTGIESYQAQWAGLKQANTALQHILEVINKPSSAIIFSHDDPDGITSGLIFKRMLMKKGWKVNHIMPEGFALQKEQFDLAIDETPDAEAVFLLDKGTLPQYNDFALKLPVYIIDHHPTNNPPERCVYFNPAAKTYVQCSASVLTHGVSYLAGTRDEFDDFLCLVGLKGDWAVEPVTGVLADFAKPFFAEYALEPFKTLFMLSKERPTMFDASQRTHTCLLSRISEFVHATGGGGFSYFYNDREEALKNVNHPKCIADALEAISDRVNEIKGIKSLDEFVKMLPQPNRELLKKIWGYFLQDWAKAEDMLNTTVKLYVLQNTSVYLFVGTKVPLLPMIGSIKLFELKNKGNDKLAQIIMVSRVSDDYTHVSVRATGTEIHSGKFCEALQESLQTRSPNFKEFVSGGGHPVAAECTVRTGYIRFITVLEAVSTALNQMWLLDYLAPFGPKDKKLKENALKYGLDYIK